ncbi:MAG: DUF1573 domain-containing protein [Paraprevotella sp.]|nr:DUF1573 domain-containing protein [Paraprevotella sp.]
MSVKGTFLLIWGTMWAGMAWAQPRAVAEREVANMGEIMFQMPSKVSFTLRNTGTEPLSIMEVIPSCGCTSVDWTHELIAPGAEGTITAVYDAKMLGVFQKDLEVYTNASDRPFYLHMQGRVVSKLSDYSGSFPIDLGNIRLNVNHVEFDDVNRGDHPMVELQVVNMGRKSYQPILMHLPPYLSAQYVPEVLTGGRIGRILLTLDSEKLNQMGLTQTSVYLARKVGDQVSEAYEITVSSVLLPDFSSLSAKERETAPCIRLSTDTLNMGALDRKRKKSMTLTVSNTGKRTLEVHTLQVFNSALSVELNDRNIAPGETAKLKVTVSAKYLTQQKGRPRVLLITNDPAHAKKIITVNVTQ